ncbi:MAG TPA: amidase [Rhodobacteraceae bacterium]|nr:amidase [Paracoccaceae bacterium]HBV56100.1 amidase [Paracoccaceae bacterium]
MGDWRFLSAAEMGRKIDAGDLDPVELAEGYLDAATQHPQGTQIYARLTPDRALNEAKAAHARAKAGRRKGPLDGVPISWKDLFDSAGTVTEAGTALLKGRVPSKDARVLATATQLGLVCIGKTHMTELAFSGLGYNPSTATPPNVHDAVRLPGGSSSGAAASVAHGLAAIGIGSDTGGSVRVPSGWNDLVGLKTTPGRLSLEGVVPLCETFDTVGPLARTVEDAALMLAALEGGKATDLTGASLTGARFAVLKDIVLDGLETAPAAGFDRALSAFAAAGATIDDLHAPEVVDAMANAGPLFTAEAYGTWKDEIEAAPDKMFAAILARFRTGADVKAADYVALWRALHRQRAIWNARIAGYDAILMPTVAIEPPKRADVAADSAYFTARNLLALRNTRVGNLMGSAAVTLPTGVAWGGVMLVGLGGSEERLLRVAAAAEAALA